MATSDQDLWPLDVPRFVILSADFAGMVLEYLDGLTDLLASGDLDRAQLLLLTKGRPVPGESINQRVTALVAEMAAVIREQLD